MTLPALSRTSIRRSAAAAPDGRPRDSSPFLAAARILLLATLFAAPWAFGAVPPWAWGGLMGLTYLTLILWAVGSAHRGLLTVRWSPLYWPFLAFILIASVQLFAGLTADHVATREAVLRLITNFVIFFLAGQLITFTKSGSGRYLKWWGLVATLLVFGLSSLALAQMMTTGHGLIYWSVRTRFGPFGPYVSPNDYCGLMEMLIPVTAGYILSGASPRVPRMLLWLGVGVGLASIAVSGSRAGAAVVLAELLLFGFIIYRYRPQGAWHRAFPLVVALVLIAAGVIGWIASAGHMGARALSLIQPDNSLQVKMGDRLWVARDTLRIARSHPWLGAGVGTFETIFPAYMTHPTDLHWTHAHDDYVEALAETGLAGGVLILWALVIFLRRALLHIPDRLRTAVGWIPMGTTVGAVGLLCHSFVDFNLRIAANAAWFVVCVAVATLPIPSPDRPLRLAREANSERHDGFLT